MIEGKKIQKKEASNVRTFTVPLSSEKIKENILIYSNTSKRPSKEELIKKAFKFHSEGNISEAVKYYQLFINQGFEDYRVFSNYGIILKGFGKLKEAELFTRKAIEINPDFAKAHSNLGNILSDLGKSQEAELSTRKAIELNPNFTEAHSNLGNILRDLGKLQEAELSTRKAIKLNPNFAEAYSNLGNVFRDLGNLQEAELSTRKAIKLNPNFAEAHSNLGNILKVLDKLQEAEESTRKAIELNPNFAEAHSNLGSILKVLGKLQEAEISTRKAIEIKPDLAEAHYNLGNILNTLGKSEEGEKSIVQCLKVNENHLQGRLTLSAMRLHQGDNSLLKHLIQSTQANNPFLNSLKWVSDLSKIPEVFFDRYSFYDAIITQSIKNRPFYEFGVYTGSSFEYLIKTFKKGYGFDTFEGLPENWNHFKKGAFSTQGTIPKINGGTFIAGMFEETLPTFFSKPRPIASVINFDADLYSSTVCALNYSKPIIDKDTILIFDEFIVHDNWEQDEYRAFNEFCLNNNFTYEVLAVSYSTYQTAVKIIGI